MSNNEIFEAYKQGFQDGFNMVFDVIENFDIELNEKEQKMGLVILYSNDCPKCKVLKSKLQAAQIKFITLKPDGLPDDYKSLPILELGETGEMLNFSEAITWVNSYAN